MGGTRCHTREVVADAASDVGLISATARRIPGARSVATMLATSMLVLLIPANGLT